MSLLPIHVYTAGNDANAKRGDPRRFLVSLDGYGPSSSGWTKVTEFQAFNGPVASGIAHYVAEAGELLSESCESARKPFGKAQH